MPSRTLCPLSRFLMGACIALGASLSASAQSGLRPASGPEGLDPAFAGGWLAPEPVQLGIASHWKENPVQRLGWAYDFGERGSLGLSYTGARELYVPSYTSAFSVEPRTFTLFGRYSLAPDWSVSAEAGSPSGSLRLNDLRIGVRRRF